MRLTYKDDKVAGGYDAVYCDEFACVGKLGPLEDIEEDLGSDLITVFKALEHGIWSIKETVNGKKLFYELVVCLGQDERGYYLAHRYSDYKCYLKDNGKTWALTKEELL